MYLLLPCWRFWSLRDVLNNEHKVDSNFVFEGVRNDESAKRSAYNRVGEGVKHVNLINCRPIIKWNATETYLYMYKNGVEINPAYTMGLTRVGCGVCPFASDWSEYVIRKRYPQIAKDYISVV